MKNVISYSLWYWTGALRNIEIDKDDNKYLEMLNQPWFTDYNIPENNKIESIKSFLYKIFQ